MTNDRLRDEAGDLSLVPADERIAGPGTTPCPQSTHYAFHYDGTRIVAIDAISSVWVAKP